VKVRSVWARIASISYSHQHTFGRSRRLWHRLAGCTGKWGRAVSVNTPATAQACDKRVSQGVEVPESTFSTVSNVKSTISQSYIVDLYAVGAKPNEESTTKLFIHQIRLHGPQGEIVRVWATFDEGALLEAMSTTAFEKTKHRLGTILPSRLLLRMANGALVKSLGKWEGEIEVEGIWVHGLFEVFDSLGAWDFLLGKRLKNALKAVHDYDIDEVTIKGVQRSAVLKNQNHIAEFRKQLKPQITTPVCVVTEEDQQVVEEETPAEINVETTHHNSKLFTRKTQPFKPERVDEILSLVTVGNDLSNDERLKVRNLISSFADILHFQYTRSTKWRGQSTD
jgi:hypothetical protein